jgi:hypothetical protein
MTVPLTPSDQQTNPSPKSLSFGEEIEITGAGFSFRPIQGFELEIDETVYMYADDGYLEIYMVGGELEEDQSIAELNDELAAEFMDNVGEFDLFEAGKDLIQGITGFLNEIRFTNAEEEGLGFCLICSPHINQYFFLLVIANADYWRSQGPSLWKDLKSTIQFQPQYQPEIIDEVSQEHPDLTTETYEGIPPGEEFLLTVEKGDASLLLAARSFDPQDTVSLQAFISPQGETLYRFDPLSGEFSSLICNQPVIGTHGEVCFFFPRTNQQSLQPGEYRFEFAAASGVGLQEIQFIVRSGRALGLQKFDLNFWLAMKETPLLDLSALDQFEASLQQALSKRLAPFNLSPGRIACIQPALDEIESFSSVTLETDLADCSYMIAESVTNERALNIGLVDTIFEGDPPQPSSADAISSGSPGMIMSQRSPHACILLHWPSFIDAPLALAEAIIQQLIIFSGIETQDTGQPENQPGLILNREIAWRLRRHPLFYDAP